MAHGDHLKVLEGGAGSAEWGSAKWGERLRKEAKALSRQLDSGYMKLAEKLWLIFDTPVEGDANRASICTSWRDEKGQHYASFDKWAEAELDIHSKKAQRLRTIWKAFKVDLELDDATLQRVVELGFCKVRELARPHVLTPRNVLSWVEKAENMSYFKLSTTVTKYLSDKAIASSQRQAEAAHAEATGTVGDVPDDDEEEALADERRIGELDVSSQRFVCDLFGDQIETVRLAIKRSSELSNSDKIGNNLSLICLDFLATNDFRFADETQRLRFLAKFEKLTGLKLIIVSSDVTEVVYGIDTLEKLAKRKE